MLDVQVLSRLLAASLMLEPAAASAEDATPFGSREFTIDEIASDLAYGFCPLFLAGQFGLDAPELAERGFGTGVQTAPDERFGNISMVTATRADGRIAFGGAKGKACVVVIEGPHREAALTALRERIEWTGLAFAPVDAQAPAIPGATVESFRAPVEDQFIYLQLSQIGTANPLVSAIMYAQDQ